MEPARTRERANGLISRDKLNSAANERDPKSLGWSRIVHIPLTIGLAAAHIILHAFAAAAIIIIIVIIVADVFTCE